MASPKRSPRTSARAFTLIEILIVVGLLVAIGSFGVVVSMESYRSSIFKDDRTLIVSALLRARSQAINNMCFGSSCTDGMSHGVHLEPGTYTVFQGNSYSASDPNNDVIVGNPGNTVSVPADIVFTKLSGDVNSAANIAITDANGHTSNIAVNREGMVTWDF